MVEAEIFIQDILIAKVSLEPLDDKEITESGQVGRIKITPVNKALTSSFLNFFYNLPQRRIGTLNSGAVDFDDLNYALSKLESPFRYKITKEPNHKPWIPEPWMIV
ncbi:MAG: hypothetical protein WBB28_01450 [Crinalium sp.]